MQHAPCNMHMHMHMHMHMQSHTHMHMCMRMHLLRTAARPPLPVHRALEEQR